MACLTGRYSLPSRLVHGDRPSSPTLGRSSTVWYSHISKPPHSALREVYYQGYSNIYRSMYRLHQLLSKPIPFVVTRARRLAPIPQASLTPAAQEEEEVAVEEALEEEISSIVDVAVRVVGCEEQIGRMIYKGMVIFNTGSSRRSLKPRLCTYCKDCPTGPDGPLYPGFD